MKRSLWRSVIQKLLTAIGITALLVELSCGFNQPLASNFADPNVSFPNNPFGSGFNNAASNVFGLPAGGGGVGVGSGPDGALTSSDQQALQNLFNEASSLNPPPGFDPGIPSDIMSQIQQYLSAANNPNTDPASLSQMQMSIVQQILTNCIDNISKTGAPVPGHALAGRWTGNHCGPYPVNQQFDVSPTQSQNQQSVFPVTGTLVGSLTVNQNGDGNASLSRQGYPNHTWSGPLTQGSQSGSGTLTPGQPICKMNVSLATSTNPDPNNYVAANLAMTKCAARAVVFLAPPMIQFLQNANPQLQQLILNQMFSAN